MKGRLIDLSYGVNRRQRVTLELDRDFRDGYEKLKDAELEIEIRRYRKKRSSSANAYFHVLVNKIAGESGESEEEVKRRLVVDYGTLARDEGGAVVGFKLPAGVDVSKIYPYTKRFDEREEGGKQFACYLVYKHTSDMNTKEFTRLIDGAIEMARELGIETDTPEELARFRAVWLEEERKQNT